MYIPRRAVRLLGLCPNTLRKYADSGKIQCVRTPAGQRLFDVNGFGAARAQESTVICYCRVSSSKQKDDLARQVVYMREQFPRAEIIRDIGSGLNFKRKGLLAILDRLLCGTKCTLVVAHRDCLARFGSEIIEYLVKRTGGELLVLDHNVQSAERELCDDILAILTVFSCRIHGKRRYKSAQAPAVPNV